MKDIVAIIGSHPRTRNEFDHSRTDCDVWVFNEALSNKTFARADAVFQMHEEAIWRNPANRNDPGHADWLKTQLETTIYMQDCYPDVPRSERFPLNEIVERFHIKHFTSSVAYAIALACFYNYKRVEIYGVEMETNTEYQYQRDGVTLWVGVALGMGIEVDAHISMFDQPLYGYEGEVVIDYHRFDERIAEVAPHLEQVSHEHKAALINVKDALKAFEVNSGKEIEDALFGAVENLVKLTEKVGLLDGARQENMKYQQKADKMRTAAGEFLFSRQEFESAAKNLSDEALKAHTGFVSHGTTLGHIHDSLKQAAKGSIKRAKLAQAYWQQLGVYIQAMNREAIFQGASQENFLYMAHLDKYIRAAGGSKSEEVLLESMRNNDAMVAA